MVGIPGPEVDRATRTLLRANAIGGVVLFRRNVRDPEQLAELTAELHAISPDRPIVVAIDHEGGRVARLDEPFTKWPPAAVVGRAASPHLAYRQGVAIGEELRAVGIDLDFAPVLDVHTNPRNPVIGDRSFGSHPRMVARLGISFAHGLQRTGVISCGKHFPGHGDTDLDSHVDLPTTRKPLADLERTELFPFRRAVQGGIECLMTAHVVFPALDPDRPATLSRKICTELLRERFHFRGVLFSDDLDMGAIVKRIGAEEAALGALDAGVDWLLFCENTEPVPAVIEAIERAAERRPRLAARLRESSARIEALRKSHFRRFRQPFRGPVPAEGFTHHRKLVRWIEERATKASLAG